MADEGDPALLTLAEALQDDPSEPTLIWGPRLEELPPLEGARLFTPDARTAQALGERVEVGVLPEPRGERRVCVRLPTSNDALAMGVAWAAAHLPTGGELWLAGAQREGIKSAPGRLGEWFGEATVRRLKRRCRVLAAARNDAPPPLAPTLDALERRFTVALPDGRELACCTLPGVFAHGRLDDGTAMLLAELEGHQGARRVLDIGCGSGVLGAWIAARDPKAKVDLCDVDAAAVEATRRTLAANGLAGAAVHHLDAARAATLGSRDLVVSNPPFHEGGKADATMVEAFVASAADLLEVDGQVLLVANRHLGYARPLEAVFREVDVVREDNRFRVWRARLPRR